MLRKQHRCGIFVAEINENETKVRSTGTMIGKAFRCDAPFGLVSIDFYKYSATLLLYITSVVSSPVALPCPRLSSVVPLDLNLNYQSK